MGTGTSSIKAVTQNTVSDRNAPVYRATKRIFDITVSGLGLIVTAPLMLGIAAAIKAEDKGPLFYASDRIGTGKKHIKIYKFRSMNVNADKQLDALRGKNDMDSDIRFKMENDPRVTRVGNFIRKTSLDELPQLWNVLKGDVSLVGPRPHSVYEVEKYDEYAMQRFKVKSGVLCYSEVCGRSDLSFEDSIDLDIKYLKEHGPLTDIKILFMAAKAIVARKGAH